MRLSVIGRDYISIDESNMDDAVLLSIPKIHIIKLQLKNVTEENIKTIVKNFSNTNRFVISDNIREYNILLKNIGKKFYVENIVDTPFISFFRKNNKVLLNLNNLRGFEREFVLNESIFSDILKNIEIVQLSQGDYDILLPLLEMWNGNVIVSK